MNITYLLWRVQVSMGLNQGYTATVYLLQENVGFPNECSVRSSEKFLVLPTYTMFCGKKKKKKRPYRWVEEI